jgi:uncharacterized protein (TIGR02466 family)
MKNRNIEEIFVTPLITYELSDITICDRVETLAKEQRALGTGMEKKNHWQSEGNIQEFSEIKDLCDSILEEGEFLFDLLGVKRDSHYINNMWVNIGVQGHHHEYHIHPNSYLSGILYVKTPILCGDTLFHNPATHNIMIQPEFNNYDKINAGKWTVTPERGKIVFFPSWIPHSVRQGHDFQENEERITLAFTMMFRSKVKRFTTNIEYI